MANPFRFKTLQRTPAPVSPVNRRRQVTKSDGQGNEIVVKGHLTDDTVAYVNGLLEPKQRPKRRSERRRR